MLCQSRAGFDHGFYLQVGAENVLVVEAGAGGTFGGQTMECLTNMKAMVAFCFEDYGQKTASSYCSYHEVKQKRNCNEICLSAQPPPHPRTFVFVGAVR